MRIEKFIKKTIFYLICIIGFNSVAFADITSSLIAHYEFEDNINDSTSNYNLSIANTGSLTYNNTGKYGKSFVFDGVNYLKTITNSINESATGTISFWMKDNDDEAGMTFLAMQDNNVTSYYSPSIYSNGSNELASHGDYAGNPLLASPVDTLFDDNWHHVVLTFSGTDTAQFYVDGVAISMQPGDLENFRIGTTMYLGAQFNPNTNAPNTPQFTPYTGEMDDVRIYNRELNATDVTELYNYSPPKLTLKAHGGAVQFDGTNYIGTSAPVMSNVDDITLETWFNWDGTAQDMGLLSMGTIDPNGYGININGSTGQIYLWIGGSGGPTLNEILTPNQWYHVSFTRSGGTWKAYLNGVEAPTNNVNTTNTPNAPSGITSIGGFPASGKFIGMIDEVRIWNIVRSDADINSSMNQQLDGNETGLVAYYNFDERIGDTIKDITDNGNDGTIEGYVTRLNFLGDGLSFTAATNKVELGRGTSDEFAILNDLSVCSNINVNSIGGTSKLMTEFAADGETLATNILYMVDVYTDGRIRYKHEYGSGDDYIVYSTQVINPSQWYNVCIVRNSSDTKIYIDGKLDSTHTVTNAPTGGTSSTLIFGEEVTTDALLDGILNEVSIWNKELSQSEIKKHMYASPDINDTTLIGYWPLNEGTGTTVYDKTSNSNNGTITGATWTNTAPTIYGTTIYTLQDILLETKLVTDNATDGPVYSEVTDNTNVTISNDILQFSSSSIGNSSVNITNTTEDIIQTISFVTYNSPYTVNLNLANLDLSDNNITDITLHGEDDLDNNISLEITGLINGDNNISTIITEDGNYSVQFTLSDNTIWWYNFSDNKLYSQKDDGQYFITTIDGKNIQKRVYTTNELALSSTNSDNQYTYQISIYDQDTQSILTVPSSSLLLDNSGTGYPNSQPGLDAIAADINANTELSNYIEASIINGALEITTKDTMYNTQFSSMLNSLVAISEVQTISITGGLAGTSSTESFTFLGYTFTSLDNSGAALSTATSISAYIAANASSIISDWNTANSNSEILSITSVGSSLTITYAVTEGDIDNIYSAISNGITFNESVEDSKGRIIGTLESDSTYETTIDYTNTISLDLDNSNWLDIKLTMEAHGGVLQFDGNSTVTTLSTITTQINNITLEAWVNWDGQDLGEGQTIFYQGNQSSSGYGLKLNPQSGTYRYSILIGGVDSLYTTEVATTGWHHISATFDGTWQLYVDGVNKTLTATSGTSGTPNTPTDYLKIGSDINFTAPFTGMLDEVRIWNIVRSATDINETINQQLSGNETGLAAYYNFDERTANTIYDITSNGNNGTSDGNVTRLNFLGEMPNFDGTESINTGNINIGSLSEFSSSAWVKYNTLSNSYNYIISKTAVYDMAINSSGKFYAFIGDGAYESNCFSDTILNSNRWYNLAYTYNDTANEINLYINGNLEKTCSTTKTMGTTGTYQMIGASDDNMGSHSLWGNFDGIISEVSIWSKTLSQSEIEQNMSAIPDTSDADLIGYWPLNEGTGTIAYDKSSYANNGTISNLIWTNTAPLIYGNTIYTAENIITSHKLVVEGNTTTPTYSYNGSVPFDIVDFNGTTGTFEYKNTIGTNSTLNINANNGGINLDTIFDVIIYDDITNNISINLENTKLSDHNITNIQIIGQDGNSEQFSIPDINSSIGDGDNNYSVNVSNYDQNFSIEFTISKFDTDSFDTSWYYNFSDGKLYPDMEDNASFKFSPQNNNTFNINVDTTNFNYYILNTNFINNDNNVAQVRFWHWYNSTNRGVIYNFDNNISFKYSEEGDYEIRFKTTDDNIWHYNPLNGDINTSKTNYISLDKYGKTLTIDLSTSNFEPITQYTDTTFRSETWQQNTTNSLYLSSVIVDNSSYITITTDKISGYDSILDISQKDLGDMIESSADIELSSIDNNNSYISFLLEDSYGYISQILITAKTAVATISQNGTILDSHTLYDNDGTNYFNEKRIKLNTWFLDGNIHFNITDINNNQLGREVILNNNSMSSFSKHSLITLLDDTSNSASDDMSINVYGITSSANINYEYYKRLPHLEFKIDLSTYNDATAQDMNNTQLFQLRTNIDWEDTEYLNLKFYQIHPIDEEVMESDITIDHKTIITSDTKEIQSITKSGNIITLQNESNVAHEEIKYQGIVDSTDMNTVLSNANISYYLSNGGYKVYSKKLLQECDIQSSQTSSRYGNINSVITDYTENNIFNNYISTNKFDNLKVLQFSSTTGELIEHDLSTDTNSNAGTWSITQNVTCDNEGTNILIDVIELNTTIDGYEDDSIGYQNQIKYNIEYTKIDDTRVMYFLNEASALELTNEYGISKSPVKQTVLTNTYNYLSLPSTITLCTNTFQSALSTCNQDYDIETIFADADALFKYNGSWNVWAPNITVQSNNYNLDILSTLDNKEGFIVKISESSKTLNIPYNLYGPMETEMTEFYQDGWYLAGTQISYSTSDIENKALKQGKTLKYILHLNNNTWNVHAPLNDENVDQTIPRISNVKKEESFWMYVE